MRSLTSSPLASALPSIVDILPGNIRSCGFLCNVLRYACDARTTRQFSSQPQHAPWTPSSELQKHKVYRKRMKWMIQTLEEERVAEALQTKSIPRFHAGDVLEVKMRVPENEGKVYTFRGVCIARYNKALRSSFKIYNVFPEVGGVVQHFPMYMPDMLEIKVVGRVPAHRAKAFHFVGQESEKFVFQTDVEKPT